MESLPNNPRSFRRRRKGNAAVVRTTRRLEVTVEREILTVVSTAHSKPAGPTPAGVPPALSGSTETSQPTSKDEVQK